MTNGGFAAMTCVGLDVFVALGPTELAAVMRSRICLPMSAVTSLYAPWVAPPISEQEATVLFSQRSHWRLTETVGFPVWVSCAATVRACDPERTGL